MKNPEADGRATWLLKPAELALKGDNRKSFEFVLRRNLQTMLAGTRAQITMGNGRYYARAREEESAAVESALDRLIGIAGWARARVFPKTADDVLRACADEGRRIFAQGARSFKIEARRTDKSFPLGSYELRCAAGDAVTEAVPDLRVDVHKPDATIRVEIRDKAYVYSDARKGIGGMPVGTAGRGLLLLSGGIDSPVAGFLMAARGMGIDAAHFHAYPYTSAQAKDKVVRLARLLGTYCMGMRLYSLDFAKAQARIRERAPPPWGTVLLRMAMADCAERIARRIKSKCLITGDSLSQVASQTIENMACAQSRATLPVLRPLVGMDKEAITAKAQKIGSYGISIEPYPDCCALFTPPRPVLRGDPAEAGALYDALEIDGLLEDALRGCETIRCGGGSAGIASAACELEGKILRED